MARVLAIVQNRYLNDARVRRETAALVDAGYDVDVISLRTEAGPFKQVVHGVRIYAIPMDRRFGSKSRYIFEYGVFLLCAGLLAAWLHLRRSYTLVQVHNLPDTLILAALLPKLLGARVVLDAHESMPESFRIKYGWSETDPRSRLLVGLQRACMALADRVLTIHEPMRQLFIARGIPAQKVAVVMNRPDERLFTVAADERPAAWDGFSLIYVGTIAERYGLQTAIRALPLLALDIPGLRLRVVGAGDYLPALRRLAHDLGVEELVSFERFIPHAEVANAYRSADVGISPLSDHLFGEICFSTKVAEYLAVGLPAVVARTRIMAHYFDDSHVAFFTPGDHVDFAARVRALYQNQAYRDRLVANGLALTRRCSWSRERERFVGVIAALVSPR